MSLQETAISKPSLDFYSTNDERLRVISTRVSVHGRAAHESSPRSMEANGNIDVPSDKGEQGPHCRIDRQVAPSDGYDELLMRDVARGDASAMRMIFLRHQQRVFRFILRLVHSHDLAQDIASEVFLDVWRFAHRFEYRSRVSTWLLSIARFKAINAIRRPVHQTLDEFGLSEIADTSDIPEVALSRKQTSSILRVGLEQLPPVHREMLDLFYYHDCSIAEISEKIGIPKATVKSRLFYARKHLARNLVSAGFSRDSVQACRDEAIGLYAP